MIFSYVFFDGDLQYNKITRSDIEKENDIIVRECGRKLPTNNKFLNFIFKVHTSDRLNDVVRLPLKRVWANKYVGEISTSKRLAFVFSGASLQLFDDMNLFGFLRKKYSNSKLVLMLRDRVEVCLKQLKNKSIDWLKDTFDVIYTINQYDVDNYGFRHINVMFSRYPVKDNPDINTSDIVFVGKKKDRTRTINSIYNKLTKLGIICDFTVYDDNPGEKVSDGIKIIHKYMDYEEMLQRSIKTKCILEITQQDIASLSSRCLEAFCYNKKLITDVKEVANSPFYNPDFIRIINSAEDIDPSFIVEDMDVNYHYDDYYSPTNLFRFMDNELCSLEELKREEQ